MGVLPSAWWAPWQVGLRGKPSLWANVISIKLEVAPQSMVSLMALWPYWAVMWGDWKIFTRCVGFCASIRGSYSSLCSGISSWCVSPSSSYSSSATRYVRATAWQSASGRYIHSHSQCAFKPRRPAAMHKTQILVVFFIWWAGWQKRGCGEWSSDTVEGFSYLHRLELIQKLWQSNKYFWL